MSDDEGQVEHLTHQVKLMAAGLVRVAEAIQNSDVSAATAQHRASLERSVRLLRRDLLLGLVLIAVVVVLANLLT